jgi:putative transposase
MPLRGRKQYDKSGNTYFITTTVMNFDGIFSLERDFNFIITSSLNYLLKEHNSQLFAYVIMPNHLHLVLYMREGESVIEFMRDFKKFTSVEIRKLADRKNRKDLLARFKQNAELARNQKYKIWMDRFDELIITTERMMGIKVNYIHFNPVKAGLVKKPEDWEFSSARNYYLDDYSLIEVSTDWSID